MRAFMVTCQARAVERERSLAALGIDPVLVWDTCPTDMPVLDRIYLTGMVMLGQAALEEGPVLLLEDDVVLDADWRERLPDAEHTHLYMPPRMREDVPTSYYGFQAIVTSPRIIKHALEHWNEVPARHCDLRLPRLASQVTTLRCIDAAEHIGVSTWGGPEHRRAP